MTAHKRHAAMKDSGVAWLGKIPAHWDVVQSRRMFDQRKEKARPGDVLLTASQKYGMIPQSLFMELEGRRVVEINKGADSLIHVEAGDFVISLRSFQGGLEFSRTGGSITFHYVPIHAVKWVHEPFFAHLFKSSTYIQALRATANLIRDGQDMRFTHFAQVPLPKIPLDEQVAIADHLDLETARIDKLIARKTRFIELLVEKRQVLITHAVTKGLNPKAKMKDSGAEWLGEVPEHWTVGASRRFFVFNPSKREIADREKSEQVSFLPMEAIGVNGELDLSNVRQISEVESGYSYFANGDIVVAKITPCFENGKGAVIRNLVGGVGFGTTELIVMRPSEQINAAYAGWLFSSVALRGYSEGYMQGSAGQKRVQDEFLKELHIPVPTLDEQTQISVFLENRTFRIDTLITKTEHSIDLLREIGRASCRERV